MRAVDVIERKRDGKELSGEEIAFLVGGYVGGDVPDYQMSAFCMAVLLRGMSNAETIALTQAMIASGDTIDFSSVGRTTVDKHSTGGVGDKVTFVVAPVAAYLGIAVPMLSGRGLGHTGGTLDKLEAIPGFRADLTAAEIVDVTTRTGMAIVSTSETIVPADKRIYALRDASGTVPSMPLIVSSIMSKKLATETNALVLDVKVGNGALFTDLTTAREFAGAAIALGRDFGRDVRAVFTAMDQPLGLAVGNGVEIEEALQTLRGQGPPDVVEVSVAIGAQMLLAGGAAQTETEAAEKFAAVLDSGAAVETFERWAKAQGGDMGAFTAAPAATRSVPVTAERDGYIQELRAIDIGRLSMQLGAGRATKEDAVDPAAGIILEAKVGRRVGKGDLLATLHTNKQGDATGWVKSFQAAVTYGDEAPLPAVLLGPDVAVIGEAAAGKPMVTAS
jgi:pyrimidine-nucleoside phosphorylase